MSAGKDMSGIDRQQDATSKLFIFGQEELVADIALDDKVEILGKVYHVKQIKWYESLGFAPSHLEVTVI